MTTDTVIPDQHEADIFDSPPQLEELNQTHAPVEDPDLESQEASIPHLDQDPMFKNLTLFLST